MYYFAYGSNMLKRRLYARVPEADYIGAPFLLPGYQLLFHKVGKDASGKCNAFHTGNENHAVEGVLFDLPHSAVGILDRYEGSGYDRKSITVLKNHGDSVQAFTYFANMIDDSLEPFSWYKQHVIAGAIEAGLSGPYVDMLKKIPTKMDVDLDRVVRELQIHNSV